MTEGRLPLSELLEKAGDGDFLRSVAEAVLQMLMEADVDGLIGAGRYERSGERTTWRNGHRDRVLDTRLGSLQLRIRSCGRAAISRHSWRRGRPRRKRWWR
jgi:putative transposase